MNGIIHNCTHPNDGSLSFLSEEQMFLAIFAYIEHLFSKIKPKKLFFLAVDGVAPRAKMNQQRSRRFRTAKEGLKARKDMERKGLEVPEGGGFDSNCITPGESSRGRMGEGEARFVEKG
jgi:5'-3' exoribonuclease 1